MIAYAEVDEILNCIEESYKSRVPEKGRLFFKEERDREYKVMIDPKKPLSNQNLKRKTIILLAMLNLNYWCDSEEEKQELINELKKNDNLVSKGSIDVFDSINTTKSDGSEEKSIVNNGLQVYENTNIFKKVLAKILRLFKK